MTCENIFCIYQKNNQCVLDEVNLNIMGVCVDCIYVDISQKTLNEFKESQLHNMESRYVLLKNKSKNHSL